MADLTWTRGQILQRAAAAGLGFAAAGRFAAASAADADVVAAPPAGVHVFASRPDLLPPVVSVLHRVPGATADGLLFTAPLSGPGARGAMLVEEDGNLVYFHPTKPVVALNFRAATYRGKPVLTWWEGVTENGLGNGSHVILDDTYRLVKRVDAGNARHADLHEFLLTDRNTALVTAWDHAEADLRPFGGPANGVVVNGMIQELELPSGRVLFEWKSMDHVGLDESYAGVGPQFDFFHVNSIQRLPDGDYLVSARNTWCVYKIDGETGEIVWRLGGKRSDFSMGTGTVFAWQHDARLHGNLLSVFDDGGDPQVQPQSKGLVLALDTKRMRASLHRRYTHYPTLHSHALGSLQRQPNGNVLIGWGTAPYFTEFTDGGRVVFDARLPKGGENYRALRFPWRGEPYFPPAVNAMSHAAGHLLFVSWNGATEVALWQLETGSSPGSLTPELKVPRTHFETSIPVSAGVKYARVAALDTQGAALGRSETLHFV
ncbi:MAG TPA: arylsulfotransferase family protein [Gaiellaceae bacterium]